MKTNFGARAVLTKALLKIVVSFGTWMGMSLAVYADCVAFNNINRSVGFTELVIEDLSNRTPNDFKQFALILENTDFESIRKTLAYSNASASYPKIRHFVAELRVLSTISATDNGRSAAMVLESQPFRERLNEVRRIVSTVCADERSGVMTGGLGISLEATSQATDTGGGLNIGTPGRRPALSVTPKSRDLAIVLIVLSFAIAAVLMLHMTLIQARLLLRNRRACQIDARLNCMMIDMPGDVVEMGKLGYIFRHHFPTREMDGEENIEGLYCTVTMGEWRLEGRILDHDEKTGVRFETPLTRKELRAIFAKSRVKPIRISPSGVSGSLRKGAFGRGDMISRKVRP